MAKNKKTILIIDDNDDFRIIMFKYLTDMGYNVMEAENGLDGLHKIRSSSNKPNLIILDIVMDTLDGIETYELIRENYVLKDMPIIFISGSEIYNEVKIKLGIKKINFLGKPIVFPVLNRMIKKLLNEEINEI